MEKQWRVWKYEGLSLRYLSKQLKRWTSYSGFWTGIASEATKSKLLDFLRAEAPCHEDKIYWMGYPLEPEIAIVRE